MSNYVDKTVIHTHCVLRN